MVQTGCYKIFTSVNIYRKMGKSFIFVVLVLSPQNEYDKLTDLCCPFQFYKPVNSIPFSSLANTTTILLFSVNWLVACLSSTQKLYVK